MNKIEEQLTNALRHRDSELTVHDELDAIINDDHIVRFSSQRDTPARRPLLAVAAAAVLAVGAGGLIWAQRTEPKAPATANAPQPAVPAPAPSTTVPAAPVSLEPTAYPTLDAVPDGLTVSAVLQEVPAGAKWTEALLGSTLDDGTIADTVAITVQTQPFKISPMPGNPPVDAQVLGQPATVYDYGSADSVPIVHVTWGSGPYFLASGPAPLDFLATVTNDTFQVSETSPSDDPPALGFGVLPAGFDVIADPAPFGEAFTGATLSIGLDNYDISVSTRNPVIAMSQSGPLRNVVVGDRPGWAFETSSFSQDIAWQVDDSTYAYLKVNVNTDPTALLELANNIRFVDQAAWTARYIPTIDAPTSTEPAET